MPKLLTNVVKHLYVVEARVNGKKRSIKVEAESEHMARQKAREMYSDCTFVAVNVFRVDDDG